MLSLLGILLLLLLPGNKAAEPLIPARELNHTTAYVFSPAPTLTDPDAPAQPQTQTLTQIEDEKQADSIREIALRTQLFRARVPGHDDDAAGTVPFGVCFIRKNLRWSLSIGDWDEINLQLSTKSAYRDVPLVLVTRSVRSQSGWEQNGSWYCVLSPADYSELSLLLTDCSGPQIDADSV